MELNFTFPRISPVTELPKSMDTSVLLLPYIPQRPFATSVVMTPALATCMERGQELYVQLEGISFYLLPITGARKQQPELAVARAAETLLKGGARSVVIDMPLEPDGMDEQLLSAYLTDLCRDHFTMKSRSRTDKTEGTQLTVESTKQTPLNAVGVDLVFSAGLTERVMANVNRGIALGKARAFLRTIWDMPANHATPENICHYVRAFIEKQGLSDVIAVKSMTPVNEDVAKMGAFLAVAKGSTVKPVFLQMAYGLALDDKASVSDFNFVGKGVTFDSGGISIKPANNMHHMKGDMGGAAAAIATVLYAAMCGLPLKIRAFMPFCENMPQGDALKPGDVVRAYDGTTIEVIDTDAEGRLILADALSYANGFATSTTLNLATLTGACRVALGGAYAALFTDSDELNAEITNAGVVGKDKVWRMPMTNDYLYMLSSKIADVTHVDRSEGGGSINGAIFLKYFVKVPSRFAHLDIANVSGKNGQATGRPLSLLAKLLDARSAHIAG